MNDSGFGNEKFESLGLMFFMYRWRKPLLTVAVVTILLSAIFSSPLFITPKYRSTVILYPTATSSIAKPLLTDRSGQRFDLLDFGQDAQTEHMLQILNSSRIRDKVTDRFQLMEHYEIPADSRYRQTRLQRIYNQNMSFRRTAYMAVMISVLDRDAQMAADIANYIASLVDSVRNDMLKDVAVPGLQIVEQQYRQIQAAVRAKEDSLQKLRELGIHEYETQAEMINQQLAIEIARNNRPAIAALQEKLDVLSLYGGAYVGLRDELLHDRRQLSNLSIRYEEAKVDAEQFIPFKFIVEEAFKAERKSYPIRWLIMMMATLGALITCVLAILLVENYQKVVRYAREKQKQVIPPNR